VLVNNKKSEFPCILIFFNKGKYIMGKKKEKRRRRKKNFFFGFQEEQRK